MLHGAMRESKVHDDDIAGEGRASGEFCGSESPAPFGFGVDPRGALAERGEADREGSGREDPEVGHSMAEGDGSDPSRLSRSRPTRFRCSLGRSWERSNAADFHQALDALAGAPKFSPSSAGRFREPDVLPAFDSSELDEALELFDDDGRLEAGRAHLCVDVAGLAPAIAAAQGGPKGSGPGVPEIFHGPTVVRLDVHEPAQGQVRRVLAALFEGRGAVVLSSAALPSLATSIVDWILDIWPDAPLELLHDDGLDCVRAAASRTDVAAQIVAPQAHFDQQLRSLQRSRVLLAEARDEELREAREGLAAGDPALEGHFGSGVVGPPLPTFEVSSEVPAPYVVDSDSEPMEAAKQVVERAFGPAVLGGFSTLATTRVLVAQSAFSRFTEALLDRLDEVEDDPRFDPPFWHFSAAGGKADVLLAARRLGLDEGATLVFERSAAGESGVPYGLVFTNGEPRMRLGHDARALGTLVLMRGDTGHRVSH